MTPTEYPALFRNADSAAAKLQKLYFRYLGGQLALLFLAALMPVIAIWFPGIVVQLIYLSCIVGACFILAVMTHRKPEQGWYLSRAIAESVKTTTWRYIMGAEPFEHGNGEREATEVFTKRLSGILRDNDPRGVHLLHSDVSGSQITQAMTDIRAMPFEGRKAVYIEKRIKNQRDWYVTKTKFNKSRAALLSSLTVLTYMLVIIWAIYQMVDDSFTQLWITEPLLVLAASILGWTQAKRHNELAASYTVATHDIINVLINIEHKDNEADFLEAVSDAEAAFSREHTQWVARRTQV